MCGRRVGDLARQLASRVGGEMYPTDLMFVARDYIVCGAADENNIPNDLTFRMPWTELSA